MTKLLLLAASAATLAAGGARAQVYGGYAPAPAYAYGGG